MIESVKDYAIILLDTHGLVTSWNVGAERIKGYRADEILGTTFAVFYTPEDIAAGKPQYELEQALRIGRFEDEGWRVRKGGARFWANVVITPLFTEEGVLFGYVKITRDISERRRAEEELLRLNTDLERRSVELEVAFKEMETFSYSVAHDLRSPLRSLDGFSRYLLDHYAERLDAQGVDYLRRMRAAAQRMARLIDDLLNLARVGRTEMRIEPVNLSRMVTEIIDGLQRHDPEREVHAEIAADVIARGDYGLLRIALEHLLENAWKFTGTRKDTHIIFAAREQEGRCVYFVRDNGVGFDMTYIDKLFQPFQRLHSEEEFPGTGIGLALVQRIIQRHGGRIWAEAVKGHEATFYFTLPEDNP
jgi:PAS domain S-box-containing protein